MKIDNSFERYLNKKDDPNYRRYQYAVSKLYGSVLDVGCGDGFGAYLMSKNKKITNIVAIDNQGKAIEKARQNLVNKKVFTYTGDAESLLFNDNFFDSVHCGQTLEHVKDDKKVVEEICRVTKKRAVFSVPIMGGISAQHVRQYDSRSIIQLLTGYFNIVSMKMFAGKHNRIVIVAEK